MDKQTQQAFALGGLKDEGGEIDEVSGNRVPIGGTKEGVRDDIPANVSEGEFIFPADVVRYHGLDKMMALRQEAKMGLKQMESMGQMGNSEEATMPDDLPFEMADLIVVGGQGEPMEFAEGGFVPQMQTLQTAPVPTMGGGTSIDRPRINYEGYTSPVVTMQEYRNEEGKSIIITSINGVATIPIPEGYTLYTPPEGDLDDDGTPSEDNPVQDAIKVVNTNNNDGSNENQSVSQPAPDYRNMNDNEFFNYMSEQNSFGGKIGTAAGYAISTMIPIPGVGLLTAALMNNHKNNLMNDMKSRIDRMPNGPAKTRALADFKEYGGEINPEKKQGLLARITTFVTGLVTPVANALGINQQDAAKVAQQAAGSSVSSAVIGDGRTSPLDGRTQSVTPTAGQTRPQLRPDASATAPVTQTGPQGTAIGAFTNQDPRQPTAFPGMGVATPTVTADDGYSPVTNLDVLAEKAERAAQPTAQQLNEARRYNLDIQSTGGQASTKNKLPSGPTDIYAPQAGDTRFGTGQPNPAAEAARRSLVRGDRGIIPTASTSSFINQSNVLNSSPVSAAIPTASVQTSVPDRVPESPDATRRYGPDELSYIDDSTFRDTRNIAADTDYNLQQTQTPVEKAQQVAYNAGRTNERVKAAQQTSAVTQQADPRATQQFGNDNYIDPNVVPSNEQSLYTGEQAQADAAREQSLTMPSQTQQAFGGSTYDEVPSGYRGPNVTAAPSLDTMDALGGIDESYRTSYGIGKDLSKIPDMIGAVSGVAQPAARETAAQRRAREVQTQQARIQTRNKEIAAATALIPASIKSSSYYNDQVKRGYTGSTTGGYAVGKISGSDGNAAGVVQRADGKVTKVRDLEGYGGLKGTQRGAMTVYSDSKGTQYTRSTSGKLTNINGSTYTGSGDGHSGGGKSGDTGSGRSGSSSGRTVAEIQADINKEVGGGKAWTSKANDLVAEREAAKKASSSGGGGDGGGSSSNNSSSSNNQSGTGFFRGEDESGNTGSDSSKGGYSCYVATALSEKGYWSHTQKIKLIKWCMEAKPEGKLDTVLWRNGYCIFGKNIIAPKVDNKIIQWLSNGFYYATINNKTTLQAILGKLFFIIPSYTIGIWKALRGSLVDIERT